MRFAQFVIPLCCLYVSSPVLSQSNDIQQLQVEYSTCLEEATAVERQKDISERSVDSIKEACSGQIAAFHSAIGSAADQLPLDQKLLEQLQK